jgi:NADPH:quinone reductase-like Zn-dependent oxidoreductase
LKAGETVIVNGATGAYGSAAVLVALAMGATRVVAAGRKKETLDKLAEAGGTRVIPETGFAALSYPTSPPTGLLGVGLGGDSSPRMIAFQARVQF